MNPKKQFRAVSYDSSYRFDRFMGKGGQGKVYKVVKNDSCFALKCFNNDYIMKDHFLGERLERLIVKGSPDSRFIWPLEIKTNNQNGVIGYIMELLAPRFRQLTMVLERKIHLSLKTLTTIGVELASGISRLHSLGLCHKDIHSQNVFFDPKSGEILIIDNDRVDVENGKPLPVMKRGWTVAPEILNWKAEKSRTPYSIKSDLYSLAALLFEILTKGGPFERKNGKENAPQWENLGKSDFIPDIWPESTFNIMALEQSKNELWYLRKTYPLFLQRLFVDSFTQGIEDPIKGRLSALEWRWAMMVLRDSIVNCNHCGNEVFFDFEKKELCSEKPGTCYVCGNPVIHPLLLKINQHQCVLSSTIQLYTHYLEENKMNDITSPFAVVEPDSRGLHFLKLRNLSQQKWITLDNTGKRGFVLPGKSALLRKRLRIGFNNCVMAEVCSCS
jgi:serine/threonine protein kinase